MRHLTLPAQVAAAAAAIALIAAAGPAWPAAAVTVHRGAETTVVQPGGVELEVGRGEPLAVQPPRPAVSAGLSDAVAAGRRLWLVDARAGRLTACVLARTTQLGQRVIRCWDRDLPD